MTSRKSKLTSILVVTFATLCLVSGAASADIGQGPSGADSSRTLAGNIAGGTYNVGLQDGSARGSGPTGPIDVKLNRTADGYDVAGIWNGGRVRFMVGKHGVRGTAVRLPVAGRLTETTCRFDVSARADGSGYAGVSHCLGEGWTRPVAFNPSAPGISDEQQVVLMLAHLMAPAGRRGL